MAYFGQNYYISNRNYAELVGYHVPLSSSLISQVLAYLWCCLLISIGLLRYDSHYPYIWGPLNYLEGLECIFKL